METIASPIEVEQKFAPLTPHTGIQVYIGDEHRGELRGLPETSRDERRGFVHEQRDAQGARQKRPALPAKDEAIAERYRRCRRNVRQVLDQMTRDPKSAAQKSGRWLHGRLRDAYKQLGFVDGQLVERYQLDSVETCCALALGLLFTHDDATVVRQCEKCHGFFVIFDMQRLNTVYCFECAPEVRRSQAAERAAAQRAGLPVHEWRKQQKRK